VKIFAGTSDLHQHAPLLPGAYFYKRYDEGVAMQVNSLPHFDDSINTTGCCPKFNPVGWDAQELHFKDKKFVHATTLSAMHIPLNMGSVFTRVHGHIQDAKAYDPSNMIVLSRDLSPWKAEHLFSATRDIEGEEMTTLSGDYFTKVFEGPYSQAQNWCKDMESLARAKGMEPKKLYFFYTTCPKCAKAYGKNYVVGVAEV
jgi:hypothetical protein